MAKIFFQSYSAKPRIVLFDCPATQSGLPNVL